MAYHWLLAIYAVLRYLKICKDENEKTVDVTSLVILFVLVFLFPLPAVAIGCIVQVCELFGDE